MLIRNKHETVLELTKPVVGPSGCFQNQISFVGVKRRAKSGGSKLFENMMVLPICFVFVFENVNLKTKQKYTLYYMPYVIQPY